MSSAVTLLILLAKKQHSVRIKLCEMAIEPQLIPASLLYARDAKSVSLMHDAIHAAYGEKGLGLLIVTNLRGSFCEQREKLLKSALALAKLSSTQLTQLESPHINYSVGWSRGHERFKNNIDTQKGSFYANPLTDHPAEGVPSSFVQKYP